MLTMPSELTSLIVTFAPLFSKPVWAHAQVLIVGALLSPASTHRHFRLARHGIE